jgi:DNA invertase Pin-like site-specific DNA recombinase
LPDLRGHCQKTLMRNRELEIEEKGSLMDEKDLDKITCFWQDWSMQQIHRVVLYARVSTRDKGQDTINQLAQLRAFCQRQGWEVIQEYIDEASGKSSDKRPQFQALMAAASRREFDLVLFWSLDRFSREGVLATLQYLQRLTGYGVNWRSLTEQYLDSCGIFRDAVLSILATIAQQERVRISERVQAGLARAKRHGRVGGRPRLVVDRDRVAAMREAGKTRAQIAAALGMSTRTVSRLWR